MPDHDQVVQAAAELIGAEGLLALTTQHLARALEVPESDLRVDRDAVVAEAYRSICIAEVASVRRTILANPSPVAQMRALLSWLATPPEGSDAIRLEAWALTRTNPGIRAAVR